MRLSVFASWAFLAFLAWNADAQSPDRPNVIVIVADDLGYGETGMMGNREIPTPNIDALAKSGIRCTNGYVTSSYCSPSRAGLITGRYQSRFGYDINPTGKRNLLPNAGLPPEESTFVAKLAEAGYRTGLVGKWHLGASEEMHPLERGFGSFYGFLHEGHFYVPGSIDSRSIDSRSIDSRSIDSRSIDSRSIDSDSVGDDDDAAHQGVLTMVRDRSLEDGSRVRSGNLIRGNYAPINEPAYDEDNPILRGTKVIKEARYLTEAITEEAVSFIDGNHDDSFCLMVCYNAVHSPMQAKLEDCETLRRIQDVQRRIFAGMLVSLDRGVGAVMAALDDHRLLRNTLVVFLSDNGGPTKELTSSNAPLRGGKGSLYEGGVRIPMIWSWPGKLPEGRSEDRTVTSLDIAATSLALAGLPADPNADGKNLFDWIDNPIGVSHETLFWRMPGGKQALRSGNWKLVRAKRDQPPELFHLPSDPGETRDLSVSEPAKLRELAARWQAINAEMPPPMTLPRLP